METETGTEIKNLDTLNNSTGKPNESEDRFITVDLTALNPEDRNKFTSLMASAGIDLEFDLAKALPKKRMQEHYLVIEFYCDFCGHYESSVYAMLWNNDLGCLVHDKRLRKDIQENPMRVETKRYRTNFCDYCPEKLFKMSKYELIDLISEHMHNARRTYDK